MEEPEHSGQTTLIPVLLTSGPKMPLSIAGLVGTSVPEKGTYLTIQLTTVTRSRSLLTL